MEELTPREYEALSLVNEKVVMTPEQLAHLMYKTQSAKPRAIELIASLLEKSLIHCFKMFPHTFACTEKGEEYLQTAPKPLKPFSL